MLEAGLGGVQEGVQRMEMSMTEKMHQLEETINKLSEALISSKVLLSNKAESSHSNTNRESNSRPMHEENEALSRIKQVGSLHDYQSEFEKLGNRVCGWTQKALVGTFMGGLKPEIAEGIRMFKPQSLKEAISLARMKDKQMKRHRQFLRPTQVNRTPLPLPTTTRAAPNAPFRRLPWEEMQKRRAQGLCFNCNERFTAGHKCQGMQLLLLEGPTDFNEITYEEVTEEADAEEVTRENDEPEITLHALTGWSAPRTMRVDAKVGFVNAVVLIDSGSTHNFISTRMADRLRLPIVPTETFTIRVANGARLQCQGKFEKVQVLLQEIPFSLTLYSLPLADLDIVLGVQWLEMLGSVICNWQTSP
uniref:Ty3 transposon capsid-like protein domain-containing protein n=1 Tax=Populus alba TaxID=43335 RepID=A0A4U5PTQ8_POPAL|nr:hypothetical protein D5086_0000187020 [Populus alba]